MAMRISEVADEAGVTTDTVRYYERLGLLPMSERSPSGYRQFEGDAARRLRFIKGAQSLGLKLAEIKELLEIQDRGACPCGHTKTLIDRRVEEVDQEIAELEELRRELRRLRDLECLSSPETATGEWPCEIEFLRRGGGEGGGE